MGLMALLVVGRYFTEPKKWESREAAEMSDESMAEEDRTQLDVAIKIGLQDQQSKWDDPPLVGDFALSAGAHSPIDTRL